MNIVIRYLSVATSEGVEKERGQLDEGVALRPVACEQQGASLWLLNVACSDAWLLNVECCMLFVACLLLLLLVCCLLACWRYAFTITVAIIATYAAEH